MRGIALAILFVAVSIPDYYPPEHYSEWVQGTAALIAIALFVGALVCIIKGEVMLADDPRFAKFWAAYPRKEHKDEARKVFTTMFKGGLHADYGMALLELLILDCKRRYRGVERQFIPCADRYLRRRRWEDEELPRTNNDPGRAEPRPRVAAPNLSDDQRALGLALLRATRRKLGA